MKCSALYQQGNETVGCKLLTTVLLCILVIHSGCKDHQTSEARPEQTATPTVETEVDQTQKPPVTVEKDGAYHVRPGREIQPAIEAAARDPEHKRVVVHAGTYRPQFAGQAMIWLNSLHDGVTVEASGEVILTGINQDVALKGRQAFPGAVNHVVYFGDGITRATVLRGFKITGARGFVTKSDEPFNIQPDIDAPNLQRKMFFFSDGGAIKIFGRSYPTIENIEAYDNFTSPCGAGISVEHRGYNEKSVLIRNCIFRNNRCPVTGSAIDLLDGSSAEIENCLFVGNLSNCPMDRISVDAGQYKPEFGTGALTLFPDSHTVVRRCTFTGNRNGIDDASSNNKYEDCILWKNDAPGGWPVGKRYEFDLVDGSGVKNCFVNGVVNDLRKTIDASQNTLDCPDPEFDEQFVPQAKEFADVGYRPVASQPAAEDSPDE